MSKFKKSLLILSVFIILIAIPVLILRNQIYKFLFKPTQTSVEVAPKPINANNEKIFEVIAENLQIPWDIAFLPDGDLLVTERPGTIKRIGQEGKTYEIQGVQHTGEGGLLGIAVHPQFKENGWVYLYLTTKNASSLINRVERYVLNQDSLTERKIILDNIPGASYHDGGKITFHLDSDSKNYLYITTGDAGKSELAQNTKSLAGKILRINDDGSVPASNPFKNEVWAYGFRNTQGIAWDNSGKLWATDHGPSGLQTGYDELNLVESGKNYGWPTIQGSQTKEEMRSPISQSGGNETWAPAGIAYYNNSLFFGGLRGESLYEAKILKNNEVSLKSHFREEFGRIRAVTLSPDGFLYITTSNKDGRGNAMLNDDKIIRINPKLL